MINKLDSLFAEIKKVINLDEIGYHQIINGKLFPIHKTETEEVSSRYWKEIHEKNPINVSDNPLLMELVGDKNTIVIKNTHKDDRSSKAFGMFGIYSVMLIPVLHNSKVKGFINIPSINKYYDYTKDEVIKCENLVKQYSTFL